MQNFKSDHWLYHDLAKLREGLSDLDATRQSIREKLEQTERCYKQRQLKIAIIEEVLEMGLCD